MANSVSAWCPGGLIKEQKNCQAVEEFWNEGAILSSFIHHGVEFTDGQKTNLKLALVEKPEAFLERTCWEVRKEIQAGIGELLPATVHFVVCGSPLSLVQESLNVPGKWTVQVSVLVVENHSDGYAEKLCLVIPYLEHFVISPINIRYLNGCYGCMITIIFSWLFEI